MKLLETNPLFEVFFYYPTLLLRVYSSGNIVTREFSPRPRMAERDQGQLILSHPLFNGQVSVSIIEQTGLDGLIPQFKGTMLSLLSNISKLV